MRRRFRIVATIVHVSCLLLCLALLIAWLSPRRMQRVFWWNHSNTLAHYQVATIRDGQLLLADYRETSISPRDQEYLRLVAVEPIVRSRIEECNAYLQEL